MADVIDFDAARRSGRRGSSTSTSKPRNVGDGDAEGRDAIYYAQCAFRGIEAVALMLAEHIHGDTNVDVEAVLTLMWQTAARGDADLDRDWSVLDGCDTEGGAL